MSNRSNRRIGGVFGHPAQNDSVGLRGRPLLKATQPKSHPMRTVERSDERIFSADNFERDSKQPRADLGTHHEAARHPGLPRLPGAGGGWWPVGHGRRSGGSAQRRRRGAAGALQAPGRPVHQRLGAAFGMQLPALGRAAVGPDQQQVEQCAVGVGFHPSRQSAPVISGGAGWHCQRRIKPLARQTGGDHQRTIPPWPDLCPASARPTSRR